MIDDIPTTFNVFVSRASDETQTTIYNDLVNKYENNNKIHIIDVDNNEQMGLNNNLRGGIFQEINKCHIFTCILTPTDINIDSNIITIINNNVLLELGYAYSCIDEENIFVFIEADEEKKKMFEKLRPSMLSSIKYKEYTSYEDIDEIIIEKYEYFKNNDDNENMLNNYVLLDKNVVSSIKCDMIKIFNDDTISISDKMNKMDYYLDKYEKCYEVNEMCFLFLSQSIYLNVGRLNNKIVNYFFYTLLYGFSWEWRNNKNNQINIFNLMKLIEYKLFRKYGCIKTKKINKNRRNFAITIFELLNTTAYRNFSNKKEIEILLEESIQNNIKNDNKNYEMYVYKLKMRYFHKTNGDKDKDFYYEDLILKTKSVYNKWVVSR